MWQHSMKLNRIISLQTKRERASKDYTMKAVGVKRGEKKTYTFP